MFQLALGQPAAAAGSFESTHLQGDLHAYLSLTALCRGDRQAVAAHAKHAAEQPTSQQNIVAWVLLESGQLSTLESFVAREMTVPRERVLFREGRIVKAELRLAKAYDAAAIAELETDRRAFRGSSSYFRATEAEADALLRQGDLSRAATLLQEASGSLTTATFTKATFSGLFWLCVRAKLGHVYRQMGRVADADRIDAEIAKLLAHADPDFKLLP